MTEIKFIKIYVAKVIELDPFDAEVLKNKDNALQYLRSEDTEKQ
jgi:hypothetical protein